MVFSSFISESSVLNTIHSSKYLKSSAWDVRSNVHRYWWKVAITTVRLFKATMCR